jgi:sec-independent protein translocase protein TatA
MNYMNTILAGIMGGWEILGILVVVLILFGAKRLPELAKGLGTGIKEFKKATRDVQEDLQGAMNLDSDEHYSPPPKKISQTSNQTDGSVPSHADSSTKVS